jgi:periplasmic divalent cation tolerance protein
MPFTPRIVFVTAPNLEEARTLAAGILKKHLAACVNLVPGLESHYWWQGNLEKSDEILLIIKSSAEQFEDLAQHIRSHHSYDCPEIVALAPHEISPAYRAWWEKESSPKGT